MNSVEINSRLLVAIDGLSSSGKGALARGLASHYGLEYLDTGKLYRAVAFEALSGNFVGDEGRLLNAASSVTITSLFRYSATDLGSDAVAVAASRIAEKMVVRQALLDIQRSFASKIEGAILDGRDIGTIVCPDATHKIFVTASLDVRAERRYRELLVNGLPVESLEAVRNSLIARDKRDKNRVIAPLVPAAGAYCIDTSHIDINTMVLMAVSYIGL